jgi:hypothetical protein
MAATLWLVRATPSSAPVALAACGIAAAAYVVTWANEFTMRVPAGHRAGCMATGMMVANAVYGASVFTSTEMTAGTVLLVSSLLLLLSGCALLLPSEPSGAASKEAPVSANGLYLLAAVLVYHVVGGLYYEVTLPQFARLESLAAWDRYYRIVPYIAGLPIAVRIRSRFGLPVLALLAVVTMGASYAVLPLLPPVSAYFLSFTLIQIAFAFSDLSLWVGLADYASAAPKRLSPYLIYSAGLCANLVGSKP